MSNSIADLLKIVERLAENINEDGVEMGGEMEPSTEEQVRALESQLDWRVPDDVRAFWTSGFKAGTGTASEDPYVELGFEFMGTDLALRDTPGDRQLYEEHWKAKTDAGELGDDQELVSFVELLRDGVGITFSNPRLFTDRKGVIWLVNTSDCVAHRVGDSLAGFLRDWIASGLISRADDRAGAEAWIERVTPHIPAERRKPIDENAWLTGYGSYFWK